MAGASTGTVVSKDIALDEEVIDVLTYWFGTAYWNKQVTMASMKTVLKFNSHCHFNGVTLIMIL